MREATVLLDDLLRKRRELEQKERDLNDDLGHVKAELCEVRGAIQELDYEIEQLDPKEHTEQDLMDALQRSIRLR